MVLVGLMLAMAGIWSVRLVLVCAGAGAAWLLADAFGAGTGTGLLVAAAGGLVAFVTGLLAARVLFFVVGLVVGAVIGARLFAILDTGEASVLLAAVFVPAVAVVGGVVVGRWRERMVGWATAIGGAALVLAGLGRVDADIPLFPSDPQGTASRARLRDVVALSVLGRFVQRRGIRSRAAETS